MTRSRRNVQVVYETEGQLLHLPVHDLLADTREPCLAAKLVEHVDRLFKAGEPQTIRIQPLGGAEVTVRLGTSDVLVLIDTFVSRFHLPASDVKPRVILDLGSNIGTTIAHFAYLSS